MCVRLNEFQHLHTGGMCCTDGQRLTELGTDGLPLTLGSFHSLTPDGARTERERATKTETIVCFAIHITRTNTYIEISVTVIHFMEFCAALFNLSAQCANVEAELRMLIATAWTSCSILSNKSPAGHWYF